MTPEQKELARHALGLPNNRRRSYRNRFYVPAGVGAFSAWQAMVAAGEAAHIPADEDKNERLHFFYLTPYGAALALNAREKLCPEDFPKVAS